MKVSLQDNGKALRNPNMGWFLAYRTDNSDDGFGVRLKDDDTIDWFPGCNGLSFRTGWGRLEPQEGKFNWDYTDRVAQKWIAKGRQVGFCWISFSTTGTVPATPLWVRDSGAKGWVYPGNNHWTPNWEDPIYLQKLDNFLRAAGERYDGKPYVAFIEIGSLGTWGEGHSWTPKGDMPAVTADAKKRHLELWRKRFPKTQLYINDDYLINDPRGQEIFDFAKRLGYSLADWSITLPRSIEPSAKFGDQVWPDRPILLEHHYYEDSANQGWWGDGSLFYACMERYRASMLRIHWFPDEFLNGGVRGLKGNKELVDRVNRRLGYRLQIIEAEWPDALRPEQKADFVVRLRNGGIARCYAGGFPSITIKQGEKIVASGIGSGQNVRDLLPNSVTPEQAETRPFPVPVRLPRIPDGKYTVWLSIGNAEGKALYNLPHDKDDGERRYCLGDLIVKK